MRHIRWAVPKESVSLTKPAVLFGFSGWNDAGQAATTALDGIINASGAELIAEIDPEEFTDFATIRPEVVIGDEGQRHLKWPIVRIYTAKMPGTDALLVVGPEPSLRWRLFAEQLLDLFDHVGADLLIALGALIAEVPHTRPTPVFGVAGDPDTIERFDLHPSTYEGPTGVVGVLVTLARARGFSTASLWAAVPSYIAQVTSPNAALALTNRACDMIGTPAPSLDLVDADEAFQRHLEALFVEDEDILHYVHRLETIADNETEDGDDTSGEVQRLQLDDIDPSEIASEIEQFLRDQDD